VVAEEAKAKTGITKNNRRKIYKERIYLKKIIL
jgi:hypothetical protein